MILWLTTLALAAPITGEVRLKGSGDPQANVTVRVGEQTLTTDESGQFTADISGVTVITVDDLGWAPFSVEVTPPVSETVLLFAVPATNHEIVVESFKPTSHLTRHVIDAEQALETPGTLEDAVRLVQALPGVTVQREFAPGQASLSVRGAAPRDNRTMLDGVEVPYLYHFNQYASVFPTTQIDTLEMYPSTFGASFGDATGGVIDARSKTDVPEALHGGAGISFVMASAQVSTPLKNGWWLAASGRRSYQDLRGETSLQYPFWPRFNDWALRVGHEGNGVRDQFFAWGAGDSYDRAIDELDVLDPAEQREVPSLAYRRAFQVVGHERRWTGTEHEGRLVHALLHDQVKADITNSGSGETRTVRLTSRADDVWSPREGWQVLAGWELRTDVEDRTVTNAGADGILVQNEAPGLARGIDVDATTVRLRTDAYIEVHRSLKNFRVMPGLRVRSDSKAALVVPEPRLGIRWRAAEQTEIKLAAGRYTQGAPTLLLLPEAGNPTLPVQDSWQIGVGVEQTVARRLEFNVDAYAKHTKNPWLVQPLQGPVALERGRAAGVEFVSRYRMRETFFLWAWVAVQKSQLERASGETIAADGDQRFSGGAVVSWDFASAWNLGARYRYGTGLPWTAINGSIYDATNDDWIPVPGAPNGERYPNYQKFDVHIEHRWVFDRWTATAYAELWWVPEKAAQLYPTWNYDYRDQGWVMGPTLLPLGGLRATF